jgi:DNA-binding HxlR family transcriptional regulator
MAPAIALTPSPDIELMRLALRSSTLSHGLRVRGDRWTAEILMGAFMGLRKFEDWISLLGISRATLTKRLQQLLALGLLQQRPYQERPQRHGYHLTQAGLKLYDQVLMIWMWERRWGSHADVLPSQLFHKTCGHTFVPVLTCSACDAKAGMNDLHFTLKPVTALLEDQAESTRSARVETLQSSSKGLGMRVDRWTLLIVTAVVLGCHHFDQIGHVLGIASSVLARRLSAMVDEGLLLAQTDLKDARRFIYRLTPASRDLFGYLVCFSTWASRDFLHQPSSIRPVHKACGKPFVPRVTCSACLAPLLPWQISFHAH